MSGQEAEIKVRLRAEGAEETKQRLLETRACTSLHRNAQNTRR